ncbi:MAG: hypothetical protein JW731_02615 [Bacteroidales bacterium]|nr:hypothetical protein [Bacteroidales bacterium]
MKKDTTIPTNGHKRNVQHDKNIFNPYSKKVISKDELGNLNGNISFHNEILMIDYLGDIYFYKRKYLGSKVYYEYFENITFD